MSKVKLMQGDNILSLKKLPDNSIDSVVTDGPYGLKFMSKKWDYDVPSVEFWKEVYRVLKPGGHVLSFGGTRTYHRMTVNIEDAGFEIRDQIMWLYGSGFPKSHNIGKSVDKIQGNDREVVGKLENYQDKSSKGKNAHMMEEVKPRIDMDITKGNSDWEGWGTALKPANEPICVARKPLSEKSVALNVLKWGTGGINIDGCRVGTNDTYNYKNGPQGNSFSVGKEPDGKRTEPVEMNSEGRFPANIILDEEAGIVMDEQSGLCGGQKTNANKKKSFGYYTEDEAYDGNSETMRGYGDKGGASRFFYQAKVSKKERNMGLDGFEEVGDIEGGRIDGKGGMGTWNTKRKNSHPTVKPVALMAYLVRLVTPPNGIVLDPFMGSGSTGIAARLEGFKFCGMEQDKSYFDIASERIENFESYREFIKK